MKTIRFFLPILPVLLAWTSAAQQGYVTGQVIDESGATLPGVNVVVNGTTHGVVTDLDGQFNLALQPGSHDLRISYVSFQTVHLDDLRVGPGETVRLKPVKMTTDSEMLNEVVVQASRVRNNETALLSMRRRSASLIDGISAAGIKEAGDSDVAASVKRVPGVSIEDGKYIYVRGLSDRYTKTLMNGFEISGLDPDRNTIQMDIFPTGILDNIIVNKTFVASMPADFTGGVIDITTKAMPDEKQGGISVSAGYSPEFHFREDHLSYGGGKTDFLGFDDGTRAIPATTDIPQFAQVVGNPDGAQARRYRSILEGFNPEMAAMKSRSFMDYGLSFTYGDKKEKTGYTLGYNFLVSYKNETSYYDDVEYGRYGLAADPGVTELQVREYQTGRFGTETATVTAMAGFALNTARSGYKLNLLHIQNGESKAGIFDYVNSDKGAIFEGYQHNLEYSQRSMSNLLLSGEHDLQSGWKLDWGLSPTLSRMYDPDIRFTRYQVRNNDVAISTEAGFPQRMWRDLNELTLAGKAGMRKEFEFLGNTAEIHFGGSHSHKFRSYEILDFHINPRGLDLLGNPNELFTEQNLWLYGDDPTSGTTVDAVFLPHNPNKFDANVANTAAFASLDFGITEKLKATVGLRFENYVQRYTGRDQLGANVLDNDRVLHSTDIFPGLNLTYALNDKQNLRFGYAKTIARPSLKELSYAEIHDPLTGRIFVGGMFRDANDVEGIVYWDGQLQSTDIHNIDLRWEAYPDLSDAVSFGVFYKRFLNPIEIVRFATQTGAYQPRNVGDGELLGAEVEVRKGLGFLWEKLSRFSVNVNITASSSRIESNPTEYQSRLEHAREGETVDKYRAMAGQTPLIINAGLNYEGGGTGFAQDLKVGLYYNVQSATLLHVGIVDHPDIYSVPFHGLNAVASKKFGKEGRMAVDLKVSNLLDQTRQEVFRSFGADDQLYSSLYGGRHFSLGFSYGF